jgi:hypothetical protein
VIQPTGRPRGRAWPPPDRPTTVTLARSLLVLLVGLALAGCSVDDGRLSKNEYSERVRAVYADVQEAFARTNVSDLGELADRVGDAQEQLREAADELEDVEPPEEAEAANAQITQGFRLYADELERLRNAAERGDQRTIDDFNARIPQLESLRSVMEAAESLKFQGYDLGPIAEE